MPDELSFIIELFDLRPDRLDHKHIRAANVAFDTSWLDIDWWYRANGPWSSFEGQEREGSKGARWTPVA